MKFENYQESLKERYLRYLWFLAWIFLFRFTPPISFFFAWRNLILKLFGAKIGNNVKIYPSCQIYSPWNLEIDDYGCLGREVDCLNYVKIKIGKNSTVSKRSFLCTGSRDYQKENIPIVGADIKIGNNCWLAAECFLSPGITVEDNSILLARSFLTKDFGPDSLIAGHPAKKIRNLN